MNQAALSLTGSPAITFIASFLIWAMFGGLAILWLIDGRVKKELVLHSFITIFLAWLISEVAKDLLPVIRPFQTNGFLPLTITIPSGASFPSFHSAAAFGLAVCVWLHDKKLGFFYLFAAFLVGIGRIMGNVHYPLDILGGAILGTFTALVTERLHLRKLWSKKA